MRLTKIPAVFIICIGLAISRLEAELVDGNHDGYVTADEVRSSMRHYGIKEVSGWW